MDLYKIPKVAFAHFQSEPLFFYDEEGYYTNNRGYIWRAGLFETAILNSSTAGFMLTGATSALRGGFFEATTQNTTNIPIPEAPEFSRAVLSDLALQCHQLAKSRFTLQQALMRRIADLSPVNQRVKLTEKLRKWWTLPDFAAFRAEVRRAFKADIPLSERSAWEDWITRDRAEIARLSAEIAAAEARIDSVVYELFALTPAEIALLEASI